MGRDELANNPGIVSLPHLPPLLQLVTTQAQALINKSILSVNARNEGELGQAEGFTSLLQLVTT